MIADWYLYTAAQNAAQLIKPVLQAPALLMLL